MITKPKPGFLVNPLHPLSRGLVGWWMFNEGDGMSLLDTSPNKLTGDITGNSGVKGWKGSIHGGAYDFDGSSDRVRFPTGAFGSILEGTRGFTAAAWVNLKSTVAGRVFTMFGNSSIIYGTILFNGSTTTVGARPISPGTFLSTTTATPAIGDWFHIAFAINWTEFTVRLYMNGVQVNEASAASTSDVFVLGNPTNEDRIAGNAGSERITGYLDDVRLYSRQLPEEEIRTLFESPYSNLLLNKVPKFIQTLSASTAPVQNTARFKRRRRLLYTRY